MFIVWFLVIICLILSIILYRNDPPPHLGIYSRPGKWYYLKYWSFYLLVWLRKRGYLAQKTENAAGYGTKISHDEALMDNVHALSDHPLAIDASYFNGYNREGYYFGAGVQRRPGGRVESLLLIRVPGLGILEWPFAPGTAADEMHPLTYSVDSGLQLVPQIPMKQWKVNLDAQLRIKGTEQICQVKGQFVWTATSPYFDFDSDVDPTSMAESIAREPWSGEFFKRLERAHQTHHEQFGELKGSLEIENYAPINDLTLHSMKDHSFGNYRNWGDFHRYILHYLATDSGLYLALHLVSMPGSLMSHLVVGFVASTVHKSTVVECSKSLWEIGEDGTPPQEYSFTVKTADNCEYKVHISKVDMTQFLCGWETEAEINSYLCQCGINGQNGTGMCEFEYRRKSTTGKPTEL